NETDLYRFSASAGDRLFFDFLGKTGMPNAFWRLLDPYGNQLFFNFFNADVDVQTLGASGSYTLLVEGAVADTAAGSYSLNVVPAPLGSATPLTLGAVASGAIATPGEQDRYAFTLAAPAQLVFDSLTNSASLNWTLTGPAGTAVSARPFNASDGI